MRFTSDKEAALGWNWPENRRCVNYTRDRAHGTTVGRLIVISLLLITMSETLLFICFLMFGLGQCPLGLTLVFTFCQENENVIKSLSLSREPFFFFDFTLKSHVKNQESQTWRNWTNVPQASAYTPVSFSLNRRTGFSEIRFQICFQIRCF